MSRKRTIFIGSSSEAYSVAEAVGRELSSADFDVRLWNQAFQSGDITIEALDRIAKECFGAIFIFAKDDGLEFRGEKKNVTRDNVILEYGLFLAHLGRAKTMALIEDGVKRPSDFVGVTDKIFKRSYLHFSEVVEHFKQQGFIDGYSTNHKAPGSFIPIFEDGMLTRLILNPTGFPPPSWHERRLYMGIAGARNWNKMSDEGRSKGQDRSDNAQKRLWSCCKQAVSNIDSITHFISFGPGDAMLDEELILKMKELNQEICYVPVDINHFLVRKSFDRIGPFTTIPMGIVVDFEERPEFAFQRVKASTPVDQKTTSAGFKLCALLGNTLANLDGKEERFMRRVCNEMALGDYLLLDVVIKGSQWTPQSDPRLRSDGYSLVYREFLASSLAWDNSMSTKDIIEKFDQQFRFEVTDTSDVPGAKVIHARHKSRHRSISKNTRYEWQEFINWTKAIGFDVVFEVQVMQDDILNDGVILLRKEKPS